MPEQVQKVLDRILEWWKKFKDTADQHCGSCACGSCNSCGSRFQA